MTNNTIGIVGIGGCGGNIAEEAQNHGFLSCAINFSQKDLDAVDVRYKLRLTGSEGVGKNRDDAIRLFQEQWETPVKFIEDHFSNVDAIIFVFSSSGGSGSGVAPLLIDIISNVMSDKVLSAFVVIPDETEATVSQANCLSTYEELSRLPISIFPIDNQQVRKNGLAKNKLFELTNKRTIQLLQKAVNYTDKFSKDGNFDKKDFLTVLNTKGIATMSEVDITSIGRNIELSTEWVSNKIADSWVNNEIFAPVEIDKVTRAAIVFDGQEMFMDYINHKSCFERFMNGIPIDLFEGYYHESNGRVLTILTGLNWCHSRLNDIELFIEQSRDKIESVFAEQKMYQSRGVGILNKIRNNESNKKQSVSDILSKYKR